MFAKDSECGGIFAETKQITGCRRSGRRQSNRQLWIDVNRRCTENSQKKKNTWWREWGCWSHISLFRFYISRYSPEVSANVELWFVTLWTSTRRPLRFQIIMKGRAFAYSEINPEELVIDGNRLWRFVKGMTERGVSTVSRDVVNVGLLQWMAQRKLQETVPNLIIAIGIYLIMAGCICGSMWTRQVAKGAWGRGEG